MPTLPLVFSVGCDCPFCCCFTNLTTTRAVKILNYRKDGSSFWNWLHLEPVFAEQSQEQSDNQGRRRVERIIGCQTDVTPIIEGGLDTVWGRPGYVLPRIADSGASSCCENPAEQDVLDCEPPSSLDFLPVVDFDSVLELSLYECLLVPFALGSCLMISAAPGGSATQRMFLQ